jgi:hypothetical protein
VWQEKEKASRAKLTGGDWKPTGKKIFCQKQMAQCDQRLEQYLQQREDRSAGAHLPEEKRKERLRKRKGNKPRFDLRTGLFRMTGTDLTRSMASMS